MTKDYTFPAIHCKEGSAWHTWSKAGAVHAKENTQGQLHHERYERAAETFAGALVQSCTPAYITRKKAFMHGVENVNQLKLI